MSAGKENVVAATQADLDSLLVERLLPRLLQALESAGPGQRLRVTTLPEAVMSAICEALQGDSRWKARLLSMTPGGPSWRTSATKIIELRNVLSEPLLVFIPPDLRTAAEDSLDIATFTELSLSTLAQDLVETLLARLRDPLRAEIIGVLSHLRQHQHIRNSDEEVEYLLTVLKNGSTPEAAGGALYVFGLLADFQLFSRGNPLFWLSRNLRVSEGLADGQPLQTAVLRLPLKPNTIQAALFGFLRVRQRGNVRAWAREVAAIPEYRALALDRWDFLDTSATDDLRLVLEPLSLPRQIEDAVAGAARLPVLNLEGRDPLKVAFRSIPPPAQAPTWKSWRVQVLSLRDGTPTVAWESNSYPKSQKHAKVSRGIKAADLQSLEEGTYFLRVDAYDTDGALLTKPRRIDDEDPNSRAENESERFLVVRGKDTSVAPEDVRAVFVPSLLDAWTRVATKALSARRRGPVPERSAIRGVWDEPMGAPLKSDVHFELAAEGFNGFSIVVPSTLRRVERDILEHPDRLVVNALSFLEVRTVADLEVKLKEKISLGTGPEVEAFLTARVAVFSAIRKHHFSANSSDEEQSGYHSGLIETVDLGPIARLIEDYARAFVELARAAHVPARSDEMASRVRALAHLDTVELRWRHSPSDPGRALVVAPTHPLHLLWHLRHTQMCDRAIQAWSDGTETAPDWRALMDQLRDGLIPMNLPMVLFDRHGRGYVEHTPLTRFWPLYLPDRGDREVPLDGVATRDRIIDHLGIRDRTVAVRTVDTRDIALRLYEYLAQHPYVEQLRLNVFNPGDGRLVAQVLRDLEQLRLRNPSDGRARSNPPRLRYSVQLFAAGEFVEATGDGLEGLLDPDRQVGEDDEFTLSTSNHLLPKLVFARNLVGEFLQSPERFPAHVSILLEQFVVRSRVARIDGHGRGSFVNGLVQEPDTQVESQQGTHFGWVRGLRPLSPRLPGSAQGLLDEAVSATQYVQASYATGQAVGREIAPVVALQLDPAAQSLLKQVHEISDWVLTLDRNLGLDYFDSPASSRESAYLLDFAPEYLQEDRQRMLLTTRSHIELENLVRPIVNRYGLGMEKGDEVLVLETLRSLSGRLALRLESGNNQAAEVVGLLLARWLLERVGLLEQRIVIPLDAHRSWFKDGDPERSQRRADLLLVGFSEPNVLRVDIVEVKLREELGPGARSDLYAEMRRQTEETADRLRERFAQDLYPQRRADGLLRAKELASVLGFYVRRARRYELLSPDETRRALRVVESLDEGYQLDIRSVGVVFEHKGRGLHVDEEELGFPVHRIGGDKASQLLAYAAGRLSERTARISDRTGVAYRSAPSSPARVALAEEFRDGELQQIRKALSIRGEPPVVIRKFAGAHEGVHPPAASHPPLVESLGSGLRDSPEVPINVATPPADPPAPEVTRLPEAPDVLMADVLCGATEMTPQFGLLGKSGTQRVAIDLNGCNTISLFGVQGFGKSYTLGVVAEMAAVENPGINVLPSPLATVIFHYHKSDAYPPEFASAVAPNSKQSEVDRLQAEYGALPAGLKDIVILAPAAKVDQRRREFPGVAVEAIKFASSELGAESWKFLLGAYGNDSLYIRQLVAIMRRHRDGLTLQTFRQEIATGALAPSAQRLADDRLNLAEPYIDDACRLGEFLRPGRTAIVDLRDEWIEKDEALGLFVVMLRIFATTKYQGKDFNKLVVFDEAHKYITESELIGQVVETIREMRHQATSVVIASQDPLSVPRAIIELTSILLLHRMTSPQWLKHLKSALVSLESLQETHLSTLAPGEALIWAQRSTDKRFTLRPQKVQVRPRFTQHGGGTKTAVAGQTIR